VNEVAQIAEAFVLTEGDCIRQHSDIRFGKLLGVRLAGRIYFREFVGSVDVECGIDRRRIAEEIEIPLYFTMSYTRDGTGPLSIAM
jgi:hypothetical protein